MKPLQNLNCWSKRLIAVVCACLIAASAAIGVSADYVTMLDHGFGYTQGYSMLDDITYVGAGDLLSQPRTLVAFWALDSFEPDTTYTCVFSCQFSASSDFSFRETKKSYVTNEKLTVSPNYNQTITAFSKAEYINGTLTITMKFNPTLMGITSFPLYATAFIPLELTNYNYFAVRVNQFSTYAEYDPGGSKFLEDYLADIKDQLHQGDDKLDSIPSNTDLSNGVSSIDSAESSIISASDPSGTALSDFSEKGKTTVTAINTSYRNTFAFINTLVTKVMDDLDFGILVFLALTLGLVAYVLGRIK